MNRVTIRIERDENEIEVSEQDSRSTWGKGYIVPSAMLLEQAVSKIRRACNIPDPVVPTDDRAGVTLLDTNRAIIYRAFDDGMGTPFAIEPSEEPGYFRFMFDGHEVMKGTEVNGTLYSICHESGNALMSVLIGEQLHDGGMSHRPTFDKESEARNYIAEISAT